MATTSFILQTRTSLSITLASLATVSYAVSSPYDATTTDPWDVIVEANITPSAASGNKQAVIFIKASLNGTDYQTGPETGNTTTNEPDLTLLGTVPLNDTGLHTRTFSVMQSLGYVPASFKIVVKNDTGASLTSGSLYTAEISGQSA